MLEISDKDQESPLVSQPQLYVLGIESSKAVTPNSHHYGSFNHQNLSKTSHDSDKLVSPASILRKKHIQSESPTKPAKSLRFPYLTPGSVPHGVLVATAIGVACGTSAYVYNLVLQWLLLNVWKTWPRYLLNLWDPSTSNVDEENLDLITPTWTIVWIPLVAMILSIGLGWTVRFVGEPGDLASTIQCVHKDGWIVLSHAAPMAIASLFSIVAGASVGPEAALVAICATLAGFISRNLFGTDPKTQRNLVRKHTLMGVRKSSFSFYVCCIFCVVL